MHKCFESLSIAKFSALYENLSKIVVVMEQNKNSVIHPINVKKDHKKPSKSLTVAKPQ
jgi:hypothetical protein